MAVNRGRGGLPRRVRRVFVESEVFGQLMADERGGGAQPRPIVLDPIFNPGPPVRVLSLTVAHRGLDRDALDSLSRLPAGQVTVEVPPIIGVSTAKLLKLATQVDRDIVVRRAT
jgi:hypothetical protein